MTERKIVELRDNGEKRYCVIGPRMAVDFHFSNISGFDPVAGLECHYKQQPSYLAGREPFDEHCWLTGVRCWGDGTSLYATEYLLPLFREMGVEAFWSVLEQEHTRRDTDAFGEPKEDTAMTAPVEGEGIAPQGRTEKILAEIAREGSTRESIAESYQLGIIECHFEQEHQFIDWPTINGALLKRYTPSGLNYIKRLAWRKR